MSDLTLREMACLQYLSWVMVATGEMIGERVDPRAGRSPRGNAMVGTKVARGLMIRHPHEALTMHLKDLNAWRITRAGRSVLSKLNNE